MKNFSVLFQNVCDIIYVKKLSFLKKKKKKKKKKYQHG